MEVETSIAPVRAAVCRVETDITVEDLMHVRGLVETANRAIKELADELEQRCIAWVEANGPFEVGDVRYYVGNDRSEKNKDLRGTVHAALKTTGGDVDAFAELLSANAFKPGACRKAMAPGVYISLFKTIVKKDLKTGKPIKRLQVVNQAFVK